MGNCGSGLDTGEVNGTAPSEENGTRTKSHKENLPSDRIAGPLIAASHKGGLAVLTWLHTTKTPPDKTWASPAGEVLRCDSSMYSFTFQLCAESEYIPT
eukprot:3576265-Pyramimonas_sp.AAC.3